MLWDLSLRGNKQGRYASILECILEILLCIGNGGKILTYLAATSCTGKNYMHWLVRCTKVRTPFSPYKVCDQCKFLF